VRLIGVGVSGLGMPPRQLSLWDAPTLEEQARQAKLRAALDVLPARFGAGVVRRGSELGEDEVERGMTMSVVHEPATWAAFPMLVPGVLLVEGIRPDGDVTARLEPRFARARVRLAGATDSDLPEVQAWRRAFSQMGLKPTQYRNRCGRPARHAGGGAARGGLRPIAASDPHGGRAALGGGRGES
jgi:hypothetical protein